MRTIIYLHGFASDGQSEKGRLLKQNFEKVYRPSLSPVPSIAISQIHNLLKKTDEILLVGSSLGGFYADYFNRLYDVPAVLINPLVDPMDLLPFVGKNKNFNSGETFEFSLKDIEFLDKIKRKKDSYSYPDSVCHVAVAMDDELLDVRKTIRSYTNSYYTLYKVSNGKHRFQRNDLFVDIVRDVYDSIEDIAFNPLYTDELYESVKLEERFINLFKEEEKLKFWDTVKELIDESYKSIGGFAGDINELLEDNHLWKLVRKDEKILAGLIYKDKLGRKGVCAFTDGTPAGKAALKSIIKEDLDRGRAWIEVSDKLENLYKYSMQAIPIPIEQVRIIMGIIGKKIISENPDGFHYTRLINGEPHEKVMYGTASFK